MYEPQRPPYIECPQISLTLRQRLRRRTPRYSGHRDGHFPDPVGLGAPEFEVVSSLITPAPDAHGAKIKVDGNRGSEIEDCTLDWTFEPESVDYIHMRWLVGSVSDWEALYAQAYRALRPGGWLESYEGTAIMESDDGSVPGDSAMGQWGKIFVNFGKTIGRPFTVVADGTQSRVMRAVGFADIEESDLKVRRQISLICWTPLSSAGSDFTAPLDSHR